jgi:hypothetical protein
MSSINAVGSIYPNAAVSGCFFHFTQCIYRKVQDSGLQNEYRNTDFNLFVRMLAALALFQLMALLTPLIRFWKDMHQLLLSRL